MTDKMIEKWNAVVEPEDTVIHGGDFALGPKQLQTETFNRLNGQKHLVLGNHDGSVSRMKSIGFLSVQKFWMEDCILVWHDPATVPPELYESCRIFLYGHVHSKSIDLLAKSRNISTEVLNYTPILKEYL